MFNRVAIATGVLALTLTTTMFANAADVTGQVVRVDPGTQLIILDDNRAYRVTPNTVVLLDNQPVNLGTLQPGQTIVIRSGESVTTAQAAPPATAPAPSTVIVQSPAAPVGTARQTLFGRLTDVDRGEVKIKTDGGSFEVKVPQDLAARLKKGDNVRLDLTFNPQ